MLLMLPFTTVTVTVTGTSLLWPFAEPVYVPSL